MGYYGPDDDRRSSFKGRLILALIIAAVGYMIYMFQVQENPVTGERQHVTLSPNQEIRLGLESAPEMAYQMGGELPDSDPRTRLVKKVGNNLVQKTNASKSPWQFQFHLLADPGTVNAFALPGGQIFITLGLFDKLENEAQLAGVLGHEMGHVIERHTAEQMAKNQLGQILIMAVGVGAGDAGNQSAQIAAFVNQMIQLSYSRKDESEADIWGIKILEQVGQDPSAMIDVMEVLKAAGGGERGQEIFQTHPNPDLRIEQIKEYLKEHPPQQKQITK